MESLRAWAKTVYLVAVISSAALLMIPKTMQKQSKFVIELLLLLCILAPAAGFVTKPYDVAGIAWGYQERNSGSVSLELFYAREVERRVTEMGVVAGLPVHSVLVETEGFAPGFSGSKVTLYLTSPVDETGSDTIDRFRELLAAHLYISVDNICFEQFQDGSS